MQKVMCDLQGDKNTTW